MANEQFVFLNKNKVPNRDEWQKSIDKCGFDFQLHPDLIAFENSGFLPCMFMGNESGFEISYIPISDVSDNLKEFANNRDYCISFRFGGEITDCASVMIASFVLAKYFDAIINFEGSTESKNLETHLKETNEIIILAKEKQVSRINTQRTKSNFTKKFHELLKNVNPDFVQNKKEKSNFIEFILKDKNNFNISYNLFHKSDEYYLCFAILLIDDYSEISLYNPFILGSRFHTSKTVYMQILQDLNMTKTDQNYPKHVWSHSQWRSNTFDNIAKAIFTPIETLYPHYNNTLFNGKDNLIKLYSEALKIINKFSDKIEHDKTSLLNSCKELGLPVEETEKISSKIYNLNAYGIAKGNKYVSGLGGQEYIDLSKIPIEYLIIQNIQPLFLNKHKLKSVIDKLEKMKL